jgi:cytochrome bd ubiquinol oxidase subunit I
MFDHFDPVSLDRAQFAFTILFHFIFPSFSIGSASFLMVLEGMWLKTKRPVYLDLFNYWSKIFAVAFGIGVVTGVVMSYEFGTNWSVFSEKAGPIIGPLMAYEVLTAFFLEAGFLGVMLFGMKKVGPGLHYFATCMVALGTLISATWIISVNSWMQTPVGFLVNSHGQFVPGSSWWTIVFSPSFPYRLVHTVIAAYLTTALAVGAVGAWHLLRDAQSPHARKLFAMGMGMVMLLAPLQMYAGDEQGRNTLDYQEPKVLAMEGDFDRSPDGAPLVLFGLPSNKDGMVHDRIAIPPIGSIILKHDPYAPLAGLKDYPKDRWPPVPIVFWSFRIMIVMAMGMFGLALWAMYARLRGTLYKWRWLHRAAVLLGPSGFVAVSAGWVTTEVGRQPYTVYGQLLTSASISPLSGTTVAASLTAFTIVYLAVVAAGIMYLLRLMASPPAPEESSAPHVPQHAAGITPAPALQHLAAKGRN